MIGNLLRNEIVPLLLLVAVSSSSVFASDHFANESHDHSHNQVDDSQASPEERVLAKMKLTSSLWRQDLNLAIASANEVVAMASTIPDPAYSNVAAAIVELIQRMIDLKSSKEVMRFEFPGSPMSPELRLQLRLAQLEAELWSGTSTKNFEPLLKDYLDAAKQCGDENLQIQQAALDLYVRVYKLDASPGSPEILKQRAEVFSESKRLGFDSGIIVALLVESSGDKSQKRFDDQARTLQKALAVAVDSNDRVLTVRSHKAVGLLFRRQKKFDLAKPHYEAAFGAAEELGSRQLAMFTLTGLMAIEMKSGRPEGAAHYRMQMEKFTAYHRQAPLMANGLNRAAVWVFGELANSRMADHYRQLVMIPTTVSTIRMLQNEADDDEVKIWNSTQAKVTAESESQAQSQQHSSETQLLKKSNAETVAKSHRSRDFFKRYSLTLTVLFLVFVPWAILYVLRSRLKNISLALDSERQDSLRTRTQCEDLALRLNRLQRMESLGLMAGSVAHDFNNILVGVMGNAEVIQLKNDAEQESLDGEFVRQRIKGIIQSAQKAASLSRQMLAYAGKQHIVKRSTDLNEVIRNYEQILRSACQPAQQLTLNLFPDPVVSKVDLTQIEQVVLNLITNAVQASSSHGQITLTTGYDYVGSVHDDSSLHGTRRIGGEFCFIEVTDTGSGISQIDLERIFEPFYTNSELGRGLGLSVVYGVITGHDGLIKCSSRFGEGTSFRVLIPVCNEIVCKSVSTIAQQHHHNKLLLDQTSSSVQKVLVIDDELTVLDLCAQMIEISGWDVIKASCGEAGLSIATERAEELSCILVDVVMPELGASELIRELENRGIHVPVVVMSGFSHTKLEFFLERPNVVSILEKPFRLAEIQQAIQEAIDIRFGNDFVTTTRLAKPAKFLK